MTDSKGNHDKQRFHEVELQMLDSLLRHALRPEPEAREARVQGVLQRLEEQSADPTVDNQQAVAKIRRRQRPVRSWILLAGAACLVLAVGLWWEVSSPSRRAYARVQEALRRVAEPGARHYNVKAVVQRPLVGKKEITADLYVDGADRFVLRHPPIPLLGELWIGRNERESWIVPTHGPILVGNGTMFQRWIANNVEDCDLATPYLHVTTILKRTSKHYDLQVLADDAVAAPGQPATSVRCRRVRGVLRDATSERPRTIDLWVDSDTGIARRLVLNWELQPGQFGRSKVTIELAGSVELPPDWFEHATHHGEDRPVLPVSFRPQPVRICPRICEQWSERKSAPASLALSAAVNANLTAKVPPSRKMLSSVNGKFSFLFSLPLAVT
jgi:hypothetical protein